MTQNSKLIISANIKNQSKSGESVSSFSPRLKALMAQGLRILSARTWASKTDENELDLPQKPKRPLTPYMRFLAKRRSEVLKAEPGILITVVTKNISQEWGKLDQEKKKILQKEYLTEMQAYVEKLEAYKQNLTPEQELQIKELKHEKVEAMKEQELRKKKKQFNIPKRPLTSFLQFSIDQRREKDENMSQQEFVKHVSSLWKSLPSEVKQKYEIEAKSRFVDYNQKILAWEEKMIRMGNQDLVRSKVSISSNKGKENQKKQLNM